jgi:hypothetical protein
MRVEELLSAEGVGEHCRGRLAGYKKPRQLHFVDSLPKEFHGENAQGRAPEAPARALGNRLEGFFTSPWRDRANVGAPARS